MTEKEKFIPDEVSPVLSAFVQPHVDSFNWMIDQGIPQAIRLMQPAFLEMPETKDLVKFTMQEVRIQRPSDHWGKPMTPAQCRQAKESYNGALSITVNVSLGEQTVTLNKTLGTVPVMVRSNRCILHKASPADLIAAKEEMNEVGGYFILNGIEKMIRLLIQQRSNYVSALIRSSFTNRGPNYTPYATQIRCMRPDRTSVTFSLHYLSNGVLNTRFQLRRNEFFIPVIILLKALVPCSDREIYEKGDHENTFLTDRLEVILRESKQWAEETKTHEACLAFIGARMRIQLQVPSTCTDAEVGTKVLNDFILVHLNNNHDKFALIVLMMQKLYALVDGEIQEDRTDAVMMHEVLLPGHIYLMLLKENLETWLSSTAAQIRRDLVTGKVDAASIVDVKYLAKVTDRIFKIGERMDYFLATGNLKSDSGLDLMQATGFTVLAEKLNYLRFMAHFRAVHRGAFFATMKTTAVRKLMPESWGFFCPVHTPDGAPCGLLNHMAVECFIQTRRAEFDPARLANLLYGYGVMSTQAGLTYPHQYLSVVLDGRVIGKVSPVHAEAIAAKLRLVKVNQSLPQVVPPYLEIAYVPKAVKGLFPGVYLWSEMSRLLRPVRYLPTGGTEYISTFEQVYMHIACLEDDLKEQTQHIEIKPTNMLSMIANLTPYSNHNQSPRNMYQCQMAKQTMATPCHTWPYRTDNKMFRLQTPQKPIVRSETYMKFDINDYPLGANAVVAVISYTGYDMEDAMIINKSAYERGFAHASVYKNEVIDVFDFRPKNDRTTKYYFSNLDEAGNLVCAELDADGLPVPGVKVGPGQPYFAYKSEADGKVVIKKYKHKEEAYVDQVTVIGFGGNKSEKGITRIGVKLRINRNPVVGDKFASRHGQKGVMSKLWPQIDMPFTESGMTPDVIINPHAFPSRMTIGMLIESMAGKSGSLHGISHDSTPFNFDEQTTPEAYFGDQLLKAGYNYYGNEPMYSGTSGREFQADIFIGIVYYQRLRHMVSDKYQVRSTGPINQLTHQPIKGRKKGGGIRIGEMERDSMLAHGASFLLKERIMNSSDATKTYVCSGCGSILSPEVRTSQWDPTGNVSCRVCESGEKVEAVEIPFVFRYLATEMAAMNIKMSLQTETVS